MAHYMHIRDTKSIKNVTLNLFQGLKNVAANFSLRFIPQAKACGYRIIIVLFLLFTIHTPSYAESPKRIVSLAPSVTEILFAAGLGDKIVGVTNFCDYPPEAKQKLKIGGMSNPSLEAIMALKPDIVVMTTDGNPQEFKERLHSMKIKTHVFEAVTLSELPGGIRKMGIALDEIERFDALASSIEGAINRFKVRSMETNPPESPYTPLWKRGAGGDFKGGRGGITESQSPNAEFKKKVLFIIWPEPLIVAGRQTAIDDAINLLGWSNIAGKTKGRYPKFSIEEIVRQSPDIIFFGRGKGMDEISGKLLKRLSSVPAVKNKKVFYVSDNLYRLGPRVIKGIEELEGHLRK